MQQPIIGVTASLYVTATGLTAGSARFCAASDYIEAVNRAGGCPVVLPYTTSSDVVDRHLDIIDGLVLTGGGDIDPYLYGEEPIPSLGEVSPGRDDYEINLVLAALNRGLPILGICRGIQVVNVALGGTLYQDLSGLAGILQHYQNSRRQVAGHKVRIKRDSLLYRTIGLEDLRTNSFHHQAVKAVAPGLKISAQTSDGTVEVIESEAKALLAVQWHPESMIRSQPIMLELFRWLVNTAAKRLGVR